jgi:carboxyl-terminal processing protease
VKRSLTASRWLAAVPACLVLMLTAGAGSAVQAAQTDQAPPPCTTPTAPPAPVTPTTISTIKQAYHCIFEHAYGGKSIDDRLLLTGAFAGFTQELNRRGLDLADATMPPLTGDRQRDWTAFSTVYQQVGGHLRDDATLRQALAAATINGMLRGLDDNHVGWQHPEPLPEGGAGRAYGLGIVTSPAAGLANAAPQETLPPLYVSSVQGGPAADNGLRAGDVIESVNGATPFADGILSSGVINMLDQRYPRSEVARVTLHRPATGRTWTVTLKPTWFTPTPEAAKVVTSKRLDGDIAYVRLAAFMPGAADMVLQAISELRDAGRLRGVALDLRGNGGGSPTEVGRLLGAFTHNKITAYQCDADGTCDANRTDDAVALLNLPLVVLTDRSCASACDHFTNAVKDLHLGSLVGTRTAGVVSGSAAEYMLNDNSMLRMPALHHLGANHEPINGIGVAPDYYLPLTAKDLSAGHDPDITKALALLKR